MTDTAIVATFTSIDGNWVEFHADGTIAEHDPYFDTVVVVRPTADEYSVALNGMQAAAAVNAEEYAYQTFVYPLVKGGNVDEATSGNVKDFNEIEETDVCECVSDITPETRELDTFDYDLAKSEYVSVNTCSDAWDYKLQIILKEWEFDLMFNWTCKHDIAGNC